MFRKLSLIAFFSFLMMSVAWAQEGRSDVTVSGIGFFPKDTTGNGVLQHGTNSGGFLASYRLGFGDHSAVEVNYGWTRNSQVYNDPVLGPFAAQKANIHEITGAYVFNFNRSSRLNPFVLGGGGALIFSPTSNTFDFIPSADTQAKGTFLYGGGVDYRLVKGLSLRLQYRGLVYKAPDFGISGISSGGWTHTAEPTAGITFRF